MPSIWSIPSVFGAAWYIKGREKYKAFRKCFKFIPETFLEAEPNDMETQFILSTRIEHLEKKPIVHVIKNLAFSLCNPSTMFLFEHNAQARNHLSNEE